MSAPLAYWRACAAASREERSYGQSVPALRPERDGSGASVIRWMDVAERQAPLRLALRARTERHIAAHAADKLALAQREAREDCTLDLADMSAAARRAARERQSIAQRDALDRARQYPMSEDELLTRVGELVESVRWLTEDERSEAVADVLLRLLKRHGNNVPADQVTREYVQRRATGHALRERERQARHSLYVENDDDEPSEDLAALRERAEGNVWAIAEAPVSADDELSADELAQRLGLDDYGTAALLYALGGYRSAADYAAAAGIAEENAAKRIQRGRNHIRRRYPDTDALVDALRDVQRTGMGEAHDQRTAAQRKEDRAQAGMIRAAQWLTEETRRRAYLLPGYGATRGRVDGASSAPLRRMSSKDKRQPASTDALRLHWRKRDDSPVRAVGWTGTGTLRKRTGEQAATERRAAARLRASVGRTGPNGLTLR